jgi:hypothetical protein
MYYYAYHLDERSAQLSLLFFGRKSAPANPTVMRPLQHFAAMPQIMFPITRLLKDGGIAQLVERQLCKLDVWGSNPHASTNSRIMEDVTRSIESMFPAPSQMLNEKGL